MTLRFLDAEAAEAAGLPWPDVYFSPAYGRALEVSDGATWEVAVYEPGPILLPYLKRAVDPVLAADVGEADLVDLVGPYGYAGAWAPADVDAQTWSAFRASFREAARDRRMPAEFLRASALVPGLDALSAADPSLQTRRLSVTFAVDLTGGPDVYWTRAEGRHRTSVRKAGKAGLTVDIAPLQTGSLDPGSDFRDLYERTMRRVEARPYYLFADEYYERLQEGLATQTMLGCVREGDRVVAAALFFFWGDLLHYHLAGSERQAARDGANNLLLDAAAREGMARGMRRFHLGGGLEEGDALHKFKRSLGGEALPFIVTRCVLDPVRYGRLTAAHAARTGRKVDDLEGSGWFPAYRAG